MFMDNVRRNGPAVRPSPPPPPPPKPPPAPAPAARPAADQSSFEPPRNKPVALQAPPTGEKNPASRPQRLGEAEKASKAALDTALRAPPSEKEAKLKDVQAAVGRELTVAGEDGNPEALKARRDQVAARSKDPAYVQTVDAAYQEAQVQQVAQQVDAAHARGGGAEAARVLRERTTALPPELASRALQASKPTIDRVTAELGRKAEDADAGMHTDDKDARAFDAVVGDLAAATGHASKALDGSAEAAIAAVGESVTRNIPPKDIGRFDEALGQAVSQGRGAELAVEVSKQLQGTGRAGQADDILENVQVGTKELHENFGKTADKVKASNEELAWLVKNWGPTVKPEALERAVNDFRKNHPEYEQLEQLGDTSARTMSVLTSLPASLAELEHGGGARDAGRKFAVERMGDATSLTRSGSEALARMVKDKKENLLDHLGDIGVPAGKSVEFFQKVGEDVVKATISEAGDAAITGDTQRMRAALDGLERRSKLLGVKADDLHNARIEIDKIADPQTTPAERWSATMRFQDKVNKLESFQGNRVLLQGLRLFTALGGTAATYQSGKKALEDPNALNFAKAASDLSGLGSGWAQVVAGITGHEAFASRVASGGNALGKVGKAGGYVGLALDTVGVFQDLSKHNYAQAGIGTANVLGGAALIAGGAWAGPGIALVAGAAIAGAQYAKVQESNKHENPTTERFLQQLGVTNPGVAHHLLNADDNGRSVGPVITALANHLKVSPQDILGSINTLSPDRAKKLVEAMHGVDPDKDGRFPLTADNDHNIIPPPPGGYPEPKDRSPRSLNGLQNWLEVNGYEIPGI